MTLSNKALERTGFDVPDWMALDLSASLFQASRRFQPVAQLGR